jgi:hypothetical protein
MSFLTELNSEVIEISNGSNGNPIVETTLTVFTGSGNTPRSGEEVSFEVLSGFQNDIVLSESSATTDSSGRCYITVKSSNSAPISTVPIRATWIPTWIDPDPIYGSQPIRKTVEIKLKGVTRGFTGTTTWLTPLEPSNPCSYVDNSPSYISSFVSTSRILCSVSGKISFSASSSSPQITWDSSSLDESILAWGICSPDRVIQFNENHINHEPTGNGFLGAPINERKNIINLVNHELGHAVFLSHNNTYASLMREDCSAAYFLTGIQTFQTVDLTIINTTYPKP